jgi:hypothetical protein
VCECRCHPDTRLKAFRQQANRCCLAAKADEALRRTSGLEVYRLAAEQRQPSAHCPLVGPAAKGPFIDPNRELPHHGYKYRQVALIRKATMFYGFITACCDPKGRQHNFVGLLLIRTGAIRKVENFPAFPRGVVMRNRCVRCGWTIRHSGRYRRSSLAKPASCCAALK